MGICPEGLMAMRTANLAPFILATVGLSGNGFSAEPERFEFESTHMGTKFRIVAYGNKEKVERAQKAAFARVAELDQIFSDYKPDSEVTKFCKANDKEPNVFRSVGREMIVVLNHANQLSKSSEGAFDVTVGPLVQLWRIARRTQQLPDAKELADAKAKVGYDKVTIDESRLMVKLAVPGMRLDFGGIVKGYAADEALAVLVMHGITQALVAASGDIRVGDAPPGKKGWNVEIASLEKGQPARTVVLANAAVSTSGDLFQFVEIKGVRYSHVLDPRTGLGLKGFRSVTAIAHSGIQADSLTKACSILSPEKAIKLIDGIEGAATFIATKEREDSPIQQSRSKRMHEYLPEK